MRLIETRLANEVKRPTFDKYLTIELSPEDCWALFNVTKETGGDPTSSGRKNIEALCNLLVKSTGLELHQVCERNGIGQYIANGHFKSNSIELARKNGEFI